MKKIVPLNRKKTHTISAVLIAKCEKEIDDAMASVYRSLIAVLDGPVATVTKPTKKQIAAKARKISRRIIKAQRK